MVLVPTHQSQSLRYSHPLGKILPCWPYVTWSSGKHILNYTGRRKLEEHMKVDDIMMLKDLPMRDFVTEVWDAVGKGFINKEDRYRIATEDWYDADHHNHDHYHDDPVVWTLMMPGTFVMRKGKGALWITAAQHCSSSHEYVPMDISG
ncbi:hypothetical protein RHMOL_Rhmol01G0120200 [Rhododendron molle]|uniref:Uncharacterized protein n=1 Tax=Rhododendron molle TaxID=49168 RepID=A0ACC0Q0T1_RHOML|nr:hypothetical protein RHMOL_Rhmol01G0120200 [Rhododendron molle]